MLSRFYLTLLIAFLVPCAIIAGLMAISIGSIPGKGGFRRTYVSHTLQLRKTFAKPPHNGYIAGMINQHVVLASPVEPSRLMLLDTTSLDAQAVAIEGSLPMAAFGVVSKVDSPFVFQMENLTPSILRCNVNDLSSTGISLPISSFTDLLPLSASTFISRKYDTSLKQDILCKVSEEKIYPERYILQAMGDGRFSLDGMLLSDAKNNKVVYVYYYRNSFVILDTGLTALRAGKTIDTISVPRIQIAALHDDRSLNLAVPPPYVNKKACVNNGRLFILSAIPADNERRTLYRNAVVDVYSLDTGMYAVSFYIPAVGGSVCTGFWISGSTVFAMYDRSVAVYSCDGL